MVNKIFYIPNLKIALSQPKKLDTRNLSGITCFVSMEEDAVQRSITDDLCKEIMSRVFEIAEKLKIAGRFNGKSIKDMYSLRTFQGKKLMFNDDDYFEWAGIDQKYKEELINYIEYFIYDYGMLNLWQSINDIVLITSKEVYNAAFKDNDGSTLTIDKDMWGLTNNDGFHEAEPLLFILEYIARLYMHHTEKIEYYSFNIGLNCIVNYTEKGHNLNFKGNGLRLLIDLAYLHTIVDSSKEFKKCECNTWFYANKQKDQIWCSRQCKSRFKMREHRMKQSIKK